MRYVNNNEQALRVLANLAAMVTAQLQEDWHGYELLVEAVVDDDAKLYGQAAALVLLETVGGYAGELADGGPYDKVDHHLRAAAAAFAKGNSERAYLLVRGRYSAASATRAIAEAWLIEAGGNRDKATTRARKACTAYQAYALTV